MKLPFSRSRSNMQTAEMEGWEERVQQIAEERRQEAKTHWFYAADDVQLPLDCNAEDISAPYLVTPDVEFDGLDFDTFPTRKGLLPDDSGNLTLDSLQRKPARFSVGFLQAWLFFGLLHEVVGVEFVEGDWKIHSRLSLANLPSLVDEQEEKIQQIGDRKSRHQLRCRIFRLVSKTLHVLNGLDSPWDVTGWPETHLAVRFLAEQLNKLSRRPLEHIYAAPRESPSISQIWAQAVLDGTWCPFQIRILLSQASRATLRYLIQLDRQGRPWTSHRECLLHDRCVANNVNNDTYVLQHTQADCEQANLEAPVSKMHHILRKGGIPVVKYQQSASGEPVLDYVEAVPRSRYAAISHLWADGLGNPFGQSICRCQLEKLARRIDSINSRFTGVRKLGVPLGDKPMTDAVYFWLDVYCVPVAARNLEGLAGPERARQLEMRKLKAAALSRMAASYAWAQYVLVLDAELVNARPPTLLGEVWTRIAVSNWNSRCWTYHEHVMGKRVVVWYNHEPHIFDDYPMTLFDALSGRSGYLDLEARAQLYQDLSWLTHRKQEGTPYFRQRQSHGGFSTAAVQRVEYLVELCNTLSYKTTTMAEDAVHVLANLLGLNAGEMSELAPVDRTKAVLRSLPHWPLDLLLVPASRNYRVSDRQTRCALEDRWIPINFHQLQMSLQCGVVEAKSTGILIDPAKMRKFSVPRFAILTLRPEKTLSWVTRLDCDIQSVGSQGTLISISCDLEVEEVVDLHFESVIVVLRTVETQRKGSGACFVPVRNKRRTMHVYFLCNVTWQVLDEGDGEDHAAVATLLSPARDFDKIFLDFDLWKWPLMLVQRETPIFRWLRIALQNFPSILIYLALFCVVIFVVILIMDGVMHAWSWHLALPFTLVIGLAVGNLLAWLIFDYKMLHSHLHSNPRSASWWQALPNFSSELLPYREKCVVFVLYIVTIPLELLYWPYIAIEWVFSTMRRRFWACVRCLRREDTLVTTEGRMANA